MTPTYATTDGSILRAERKAAGVNLDEVAAQFIPPTTRQRLSRMEKPGREVSYVDATAFRAAIAAAVAVKVGRAA